LDLSLPVRSNSIVGFTIGLLDPENIGLAVGIVLLSVYKWRFPMKKSLLYLLMKMAHHLTFHPQFRSCPDNMDVDIDMNSTVFKTSNYR